ncbi:hypothetical protein [Nisaea sediminum]|uniref:hypothetical protein n=1 Tax=Nisaea sediminum TaxID=2775867 RepID=UPI0018663803|nr:hypothetical protein [Nisaea sediminum]
MTNLTQVRPEERTVSPANHGPGEELLGRQAELDEIAEQRGDSDGMLVRTDEPGEPSSGKPANNEADEPSSKSRTRTSVKAESGSRKSGRYAPVENTDIERRVLAHEKILQCLIAQMAETEPRYLDRLRSIFSRPGVLERSEHDFTDTASYADEFIKTITKMCQPAYLSVIVPPASPARHEPEKTRRAPVPAFRQAEQNRFRIVRKSGIWNVTRNGRFLGDYFVRIDAEKAIHRALSDMFLHSDQVHVTLQAPPKTTP